MLQMASQQSCSHSCLPHQSLGISFLPYVFLIFIAARHPSQGFVATAQRYEKVSKEQNKIGTIFFRTFAITAARLQLLF